MPPVWKSRRVLPDGFAAVQVHLTGPQSLHPPSFGFAMEAVGAVAAAARAVDWIEEATTGFLANLHIDYAVEKVTAQDEDSSIETYLSAPGELIGTDLLTPAVACLVRLSTALPGRRGSGRMYWPGVLGDGDVDNGGRIDNDTRFDELQACAGSFMTNITDGTETPVLLHSYRWPYGDDDPDPGEPVGFPAPTPVTAANVQRVVATQRRRQR